MREVDSLFEFFFRPLGVEEVYGDGVICSFPFGGGLTLLPARIP